MPSAVHDLRRLGRGSLGLFGPGLEAKKAPQRASRAIATGGKVRHNAYETWKLDTQRRAPFNFTNKQGTLCHRCVKRCAWSHPDTLPHPMIREPVLRVPAGRPLSSGARG